MKNKFQENKTMLLRLKIKFLQTKKIFITTILFGLA